MAINATTDYVKRDLIPAGNYQARCWFMVEIGTVQEQFPGKGSKSLKKVRIGWELPTELIDIDGVKKPVALDKEYTLSMYKGSHLRIDLASWRGKDFSDEEAKLFDVTKLLGKTCLVNIIHKASKQDATKIYELISGITPGPKGMTILPAVNPILECSYDKWNEELFESLPEFIRNKIASSEEYKLMKANPPGTSQAQAVSNDINGVEIEDLPF